MSELKKSEKLEKPKPTLIDPSFILKLASAADSQGYTREQPPVLKYIDADFLLELGAVLNYGATKYTPEAWKEMCASRPYKQVKGIFLDATLRHIYAYMAGLFLDEESEYPHVVHAVANLMFLYYLETEPKYED